MINNSMNIIPINNKNELTKFRKRLSAQDKQKILTFTHLFYEIAKVIIVLCLGVLILRFPKIISLIAPLPQIYIIPGLVILLGSMIVMGISVFIYPFFKKIFK